MNYISQFIINIEGITMGDKYIKSLKATNKQIDFNLFQKYVVNSQENMNQIIFNIRTSKPLSLPRFNTWRLLLQIIQFQQSWQQKIASVQSYRKRWSSLKQQSRPSLKPIVKQGLAPVSKNPLFKGVLKAQKKQPQSDNFLTEQIKKDVSRTYQQLQFFQDENIQKLLTNILFVWSKTNPDISYKQGINELLASVVWVYFQEAPPHSFSPTNDLQKQYLQLNHTEHVEADIFIVFEKLMEVQKEMFKQNFDSQVKGIINPNSKNNSPILQRISQIEDNKLKLLDIELYRALKLQDVKTKTFLLRWIRCLHTRQFGLKGSLPIWDSILLDHYDSVSNGRGKRQFEFVDAMCLSMFLYARSVVLTLQTTNQIIKVYQQYPQFEGHDLQQLLGLAWSVCQQLRNIGSSEKLEQTKLIKKQQEKNPVSKISKQEQAKIQSVQATIKKESIPKNSKQKTQIIGGISPQKKQIVIDSIQVKNLIEKLSQSNSYNENAQSKKLVRCVIDRLQSRING